jgi:hypothetical protein
MKICIRTQRLLVAFLYAAMKSCILKFRDCLISCSQFSVGHFVCSACRDKLPGTEGVCCVLLAHLRPLPQCGAYHRLHSLAMLISHTGLHWCDPLPPEGRTREGVPARALLLPSQRLLLCGHDNCARGPLHCTVQVADDGFQNESEFYCLPMTSRAKIF